MSHQEQTRIVNQSNIRLELYKISDGTTLILKKGQYKGPITINKNIIIDGKGNGPVIFSSELPVFIINSDEVLLKNIEIKYTMPDVYDAEHNFGISKCSPIEIKKENARVLLENVVTNVPILNCEWVKIPPLRLPQEIDFDRVKANAVIEKRIVIKLDDHYFVRSIDNGIEISPQKLNPGRQILEIKLNVGNMENLVPGLSVTKPVVLTNMSNKEKTYKINLKFKVDDDIDWGNKLFLKNKRNYHVLLNLTGVENREGADFLRQLLNKHFHVAKVETKIIKINTGTDNHQINFGVKLFIDKNQFRQSCNPPQNFKYRNKGILLDCECSNAAFYELHVKNFHLLDRHNAKQLQKTIRRKYDVFFHRHVRPEIRSIENVTNLEAMILNGIKLHELCTFDDLDFWNTLLDMEEIISKEKRFIVEIVSHDFTVMNKTVNFRIRVIDQSILDNYIYDDDVNDIGTEMDMLWYKIKNATGDLIKVCTNKNILDSLIEVGEIVDSIRSKNILVVKLSDDLFNALIEYKKNTDDLYSEKYKLFFNYLLGYKKNSRNTFYFYYDMFGDLFQIKRKRKALSDLENDKYENFNVIEGLSHPESLLPVINKREISYNQILLKSINDSQKSAVETALSAPHISLIQGPPGTGKTTVITEICYQVAKNGGNVLIASNTNLAVDNVLKNLQNHKDMIIIRLGNSERITDEGKRFSEDNIISTFFGNILDECTKTLESKRRNLKTIKQIKHHLKPLEQFKVLYSLKRFYQNSLKNKSIQLQHHIKHLKDLQISKNRYENRIKTLKNVQENLDSHKLIIDVIEKNSELSNHITPFINTVNIILEKLKNISCFTNIPSEINSISDLFNLHMKTKTFLTEIKSIEFISSQVDSCVENILDSEKKIENLRKNLMNKNEELKTLESRKSRILKEQNKSVSKKNKIKENSKMLKDAYNFFEKLEKSIDRRISHYHLKNLIIKYLGKQTSELLFLVKLMEINSNNKVKLQKLKNDFENLMLKSQIKNFREKFLRNGTDEHFHNVKKDIEEIIIYKKGDEILDIFEKDIETLNSRIIEILEETNKNDIVSFLIQLFHTIINRDRYFSERSKIDNVIYDIKKLNYFFKIIQDSYIDEMYKNTILLLKNNLLKKINQLSDTYNNIKNTIEIHRKNIDDLNKKILNLEDAAADDTMILEQLEINHEKFKKTIKKTFLKTIGPYLAKVEYIDPASFMIPDDDFTSSTLKKRLNDTRNIRKNLSSLVDVLNELKNTFLKKIKRDYEELNIKKEAKSEDIQSKKRLLDDKINSIKEISLKLNKVVKQESRFTQWIDNNRDLLAKYLNIDRESEISPDTIFAKLNELDQSKQEIEYWLKRYGPLMEIWLAKLKNYHEENIKDLYISLANVIGTTCNYAYSASLRNKRFDVVIIDEVSKSSLLDVLLPAMKGEKLILVGDYMQLPPLIDHNVLKKTLHHLGINIAKLKQFAEMHYFRNIYKKAHSSIKTMLTIQYRMHPVIMSCINQFYDDMLVCGLRPEERINNLSCKYIKKGKHVFWITTPNNKGYYETLNGTSFSNVKETEIIMKLCEDLDKGSRILFETSRKKHLEVAIITFYKAQENLIKSRIDTNMYPHLELKIGTVDRFQGMEREIVIVSLVRNNKQQNIGFASKAERINVAFSRAQNILIIVGSHKMFTSKNVNAHMPYLNIFNTIKQHGGVINAEQIIN